MNTRYFYWPDAEFVAFAGGGSVFFPKTATIRKKKTKNRRMPPIAYMKYIPAVPTTPSTLELGF
jgi:hypothetical protein